MPCPLSLNFVFKYSSNAELFFPVFYDLDFPFIKDISTQFDQLNQLVISLKKVEESTLKSLITETINKLILLFALSKIIQEDLLASEIDDLRYYLKKNIETKIDSSKLFGKTFNKLTINISNLSESLKEKINEKIDKKKEEKAA